MFRISLFFCMIFMVLPIHSQGIVRQQGYVRTVGRPGNKAGQRLSGVVLKVSGQHNMVKSGRMASSHLHSMGCVKARMRFPSLQCV